MPNNIGVGTPISYTPTNIKGGTPISHTPLYKTSKHAIYQEGTFIHSLLRLT